MTTITVPIELELTPRSKAVMEALQRALGPQFVAEDQPAQASAIPAIGAPWPGIEGSAYAGISRGENGEPDAHLVLLSDRPERDMNWHDAMEYAKQRQAELPSPAMVGWSAAMVASRFESALLYANLRDRMDTGAWHWTRTQSSENAAWYQFFDNGNQYYDGKKAEGRVRLVRRFPL